MAGREGATRYLDQEGVGAGEGRGEGARGLEQPLAVAGEVHAAALDEEQGQEDEQRGPRLEELAAALLFLTLDSGRDVDLSLANRQIRRKWSHRARRRRRGPPSAAVLKEEMEGWGSWCSGRCWHYSEEPVVEAAELGAGIEAADCGAGRRRSRGSGGVS